MRLAPCSIVPMLAMLQPSLAWSLTFYNSSCPAPGETGDVMDAVAGQPGSGLACSPVNSAHNVIADGLDHDAMKATLWADWLCKESFIATIENDGCQVIPSTTTIAGVTIDPK
ncbi:hypothetical protein GQ53DRAFT_764612 [Thozetella sp. PMI_491]|nr:hypothetical protein GQ53DRAFT_764612 [Thozetella sp. PMI_491]